ncbi:hypothetical protein Tco_0697793 [Tanacetum coccineum]
MRHNQSHPCGAVAVTEQTPLVVVFIHRNKPLLVVAVVGKTRNGEWRVRASDYGERVDPMERRLFGVGRKSPPEKFSGGGNRWLAAAWWPAAISKREGRCTIFTMLPKCDYFLCGGRGLTPASETSELNPEDATARLEDIKVEIGTLHADTEDKELLISELQVSHFAAAEKKE